MNMSIGRWWEPKWADGNRVSHRSLRGSCHRGIPGSHLFGDQMISGGRNGVTWCDFYGLSMTCDYIYVAGLCAEKWNTANTLLRDEWIDKSITETARCYLLWCLGMSEHDHPKKCKELQGLMLSMEILVGSWVFKVWHIAWRYGKLSSQSGFRMWVKLSESSTGLQCGWLATKTRQVI